MNYRILSAGDKAIVVEFGNTIDEATNQMVHHLAEYLNKKQLFGIVELIPTFRSLMIQFEPALLSREALEEVICSFDANNTCFEASIKHVIEIPCCYSTRFGIDLPAIELEKQMDRDELIRIHSGRDYKIYMLGFLPGFVYLGGLDPRIELPRLSSPRVRINPGTVGIGGNQTGVYPIASPGGWRLIGGTPVDFYHPTREQPILCQAGEYIRFTPIFIDEYYEIRALIQKGLYEPKRLEVKEAWQ